MIDLSDIFTGRLIEEVPLALTHLVQSLTDKSELHTVDLSHNAFGPAGTRAFVQLIMHNHSIRTLKVINNGLGIGGGTIIAQSLLEALSQKNNTDNNNTDNNNNNNTEQSQPRIETFEAGRNRLENSGATELARAFEQMRTLTSLHLPQNGIRPEGITALARAISVNSDQFTDLNLSDNTIKQEGAQSIATAIAQMPQLRHLNLGDCLLGTEGAILVANALREGHEMLETVDLVFNEMGDDAAMALIEALEGKKQLKRVELNGNEFSASVLKALEESSFGHLLGTMSDNEGDDEDEDEDDEDDEDDEENEDDDE